MRPYRIALRMFLGVGVQVASCAAVRPRGSRCALAVGLIVAALVAMAGCQSLSRHSPLPRSVANCRQLSQQGLNAMERGEWTQAENFLARAVQTCPVDLEARRHYAEALWRRGARTQAIAQLEDARKTAQDDTALAVRLGEYYLAQNQWEAARRLADQAIELDPKAATAWALHGRVLAATGETRAALADFQRSLGYAPGNNDVLLEVAEAYRWLGQPDRALTALQGLLDTYAPGDEPQHVLHLQGLALMALNRHDDAAESLALANLRGKPSADILSTLAEAQLAAGHPHEAANAVEQALLVNPSHAPSRALHTRMQVARNFLPPLR